MTPARLELLDPLVRRRPGHPEVGAELRVRPPAVDLEERQEARVGLADGSFFATWSLFIR